MFYDGSEESQAAQSSGRKVIVAVLAKFDARGKITPLSVTWPDGRRFEVTRVKSVTRAASLKAGGCGTRFLCTIAGKEAALFYEEPIWFMEGKEMR